MTELVPTDEIEAKVGAKRHATVHLARAVSAEGTVYLLHSRQCVERYRDDVDQDLRDCEFSVALDRGISTVRWTGYEDAAVVVGIRHPRNGVPTLVPTRREAYHGVSG